MTEVDGYMEKVCIEAGKMEHDQNYDFEDEEVDEINHPLHYNSHPSGVECVDIAEHFSYCLGNAIKYIWRAGLKTEDKTQDLEKAVWYIKREIQSSRT